MRSHFALPAALGLALTVLMYGCSKSGPSSSATSPAVSPSSPAVTPPSSTAPSTASPAPSASTASPAPSASTPVAPPTTPGSAQGLPNFEHVVVVMMENHEYGDIIGSPDAPYINSLAAGGALATKYYAITHPSLPNYLAISGGTTFGISKNCNPGPSCAVSQPGIADQLVAANKSWKGYMEDLPSPCAKKNAGGYAVRHNPFVYYDKIAADSCGNVVPVSQLQADLTAGQLPRFAWVTPNTCNDMHDCSVKAGDTYLAGLLPKILGALGSNGVLFVLWDEGTTDLGGGQAGTAGGQVALIAAGPSVKKGYKSSTLSNHYSLLRTIEDAWGLTPLNKAAGASALKDLFAG